MESKGVEEEKRKNRCERRWGTTPELQIRLRVNNIIQLDIKVLSPKFFTAGEKDEEEQERKGEDKMGLLPIKIPSSSSGSEVMEFWWPFLQLFHQNLLLHFRMQASSSFWSWVTFKLSNGCECFQSWFHSVIHCKLVQFWLIYLLN